MEIFRIAAIGIITALCVLVLRENRSDIATLIGITGGVIILLSLIDYFTQIFDFLRRFIEKTGIDGSVKMNTLDLPVLLQLRFLGFLAVQVGPTFNLMTDVGGSTQDTKWRIDRPTMGYAVGVDVRLWKFNVAARYNGSFKKSEVLGITTGENRISTFQLGLGFFF